MSIEVVFEKRINNANVCRDVDVAQRRQYFLLTFLSAVFVVGLLLYGWQQYRWISLGYDIEKAKIKKQELLEYQRQLIVQEQIWAAPGRIDETARIDLGMVVAAPGQIVRLGSDEDWSAPKGADEAAEPLTASTQR
jgi:cell division protein FtsL